MSIISRLRRRKTSRSKNTDPEDTSNIQSSTREIPNSESKSNPQTTNEEIEGTPFRLINIPEHGWFISLGQNRVSGIYETREAATEPLRERDWQMMCNVIVTLIQQVNEISQSTKTAQQ